MKATGIVRRIDDLGRVVIPKEIRRTLRIREGDPLEIFVDRDGEVILKKYSPIGELGEHAREFAEALHDATGLVALVADRDAIIAVAGAPKKEFMDKRVGQAVERIMQGRQPVLVENPPQKPFPGTLLAEDEEDTRFAAYVVAPILSAGEPVGAVILGARDPGTRLGEVELKLAATAAHFMGKQMED